MTTDVIFQAQSTASKDRLKAELLALQLEGSEVAEHQGQLTVVVPIENYLATCQQLRDVLGFDQLIDLCGVDYEGYADDEEGAAVIKKARFAVVSQLLSVVHNRRLRVRVFSQEDAFPVFPSLITLWPNANWYEREAFDMMGLMFDGHPDLRRILTDYGFVGHPRRKDFPLSGHVEMRYDPQAKRVIYQPVTIEPREITPRIRREPQYAGQQ